MEVDQHGRKDRGRYVGVDNQAGMLRHRLSTEEGQSGAPVVRYGRGGSLFIHGMHLSENTSEDDCSQQNKKRFNVALLMTV